MDEAYPNGLKMPVPDNLVGTWRRFGAVGPVYEIIHAGTELGGGDRVMRIRVVETGEELDYRLAEILDDPRDRYCSLLPSISWLRTRLKTTRRAFHRPRRISVPPWQISASIGFRGAWTPLPRRTWPTPSARSAH